MTINELTEKVITATRNNAFAKDVVQIHVEQGVYLLIDSGVDERIALSERAIGFLCAYLTDVDTSDSGNIKLSSYTKAKLSQLTLLTPTEDESIKCGALFIDFDYDDEVTLNINKNGILKFTYQIERAVVEMLQVGDYEVELVLPNGTIKTEAVSVIENKVSEIYFESDNVPVVFSCKNTSGQNLPGCVFSFTNTTTEEIIGEFTTDKEDKIIKIPEGSYLIKAVYTPPYYVIDDINFDVVKGEDNFIEIINKDVFFGHSSVSIYVNNKTITVWGIDDVFVGTWLIKDKKTNNIIQRYDCSYENPVSMMYMYGLKDGKTEYIAEFIPDDKLIKPLYATYKVNQTNFNLYLQTENGTGLLYLNPYVGSSKVSNLIGSDIEEYTIKFTNVSTSETTIKTFKFKYIKPESPTVTNWYPSQYIILPSGYYDVEIVDIKSTEKTYKQQGPITRFSLNNQSYNSITVKMEEVVEDV